MAVNNKPETKAQAIRKRLALARNTSGEGPAAMPAKPRGRPFQKKQPPPVDAPPPDSSDARAVMGDDSPHTPPPQPEAAADDSGSAPGPADSQGSEPAAPSIDVPPSIDGRPASAKVRSDSKKRKRGRPRNDERAHTVKSDAPKERARNTSNAHSAGFAGALLVLHAGLATLMKAPEMQISDTEATMYAGALDNFAREFGVPISSKAQAAITLVGVMGMIYVPRFAAINARRRTTRAKPADAPAPGATGNPPDWGAIAASANQPPVVGGG